MARKLYSPTFKFTVVLEALKERKTLQEIASENGIAPSQISRWVDEFKWRASLFFLKTCLALKKLNFLKINNMNFTLKLVNLALRMIG
ncbi:MAG: transposase [Fusobacteriaceae bacterium]